MLNQPTIEKLHTMKLHGMADAFRAQIETADASQLGFEERFAMLVHEPTLVSSEKTRQELRAALTKWAATGFEDRVENGSQQFGLEQMMRFLGPESVKTLPGILTENASRMSTA